MAEQSAGFARARTAGAWFSASPRVQRLAAIQVALLLGAASVTVAVHRRPPAGAEPLTLAAATGPAAAPVVVNDREPPAQATGRQVRRAVKAKQAQPRRAADAGWAYWSVRIRGCESHGRPDAPPDYKARNPQSSASGAYQILDTTWGGRYGVAHASDATPQQQDAVAADLYRRHGTADWAASAPCWRSR